MLTRFFTGYFTLLVVLTTSLEVSSATLRLGEVAFHNSAAQGAQEAFLDGLAALHCFWYEKAREKFREAQKIDPDFALAYWGEVMTFNHPVWNQQDYEGARARMASFAAGPQQRIAKGKLAIERELIESLEILYGGGPKQERDGKYRDFMRQLAAKYKTDIEVQSFYALSILGCVNSFEGNYEKQLNAANVLEAHLKSDQKRALSHPGLLHYLIHAYDHPRYASRALSYADMYANVSPDAAHALHMPSHIYLQLGLWDKVASQNETSYRASLNWAQRDKLGVAVYDFHSLYWRMYAYLQQGRYESAHAVLAEMAKVAKTDASQRVAAYYGMMQVRYALETNDFASLTSNDTVHGKHHASDPLHAACMGAETESHRIGRVYAEGVAAVRSADLKKAALMMKAMDSLKSIYPSDEGGFKQKVLEIERLALAGLIAIAKSETKAGIGHMRAAAELEMKLDPPSGPPVPTKPAIEVLAEQLLIQGQAREALMWFERALERTPQRTAALVGAYRASKALGAKQASERYQAHLQRNLSRADPSVHKLL